MIDQSEPNDRNIQWAHGLSSLLASEERSRVNEHPPSDTTTQNTDACRPTTPVRRFPKSTNGRSRRIFLWLRWLAGLQFPGQHLVGWILRLLAVTAFPAKKKRSHSWHRTKHETAPARRTVEKTKTAFSGRGLLAVCFVEGRTPGFRHAHGQHAAHAEHRGVASEGTRTASAQDHPGEERTENPEEVLNFKSGDIRQGGDGAH